MTSPLTSTRSVADVKQHRLERVAEHLRLLAARIISGDVDVARFDFNRQLEVLDPEPGQEWEENRPRRGADGDETYSVSLQLVPYCECGLVTGGDADSEGPKRWALKGDGHECQETED